MQLIGNFWAYRCSLAPPSGAAGHRALLCSPSLRWVSGSCRSNKEWSCSSRCDVAYFYGSIGFQQRDAILEQACIRSNFYYKGKFDIFWNGMLTRPQRMNSFINLQVLQIFFWHLYSEFVLSSQKEWYHKKTYVFELLWRLYLLFNRRSTFVGSSPFHLRKDLNFHEICMFTFGLKVLYPSAWFFTTITAIKLL